MSRGHIFPDDPPPPDTNAQEEALRLKRLRRDIIERHARKWTYGPKRGHVMFCTQSRAELSGEAPNRGSAGKVIYDTLEDAVRAAAELLAATGADMKPYECPRSRHGHHHLTHGDHRTYPRRETP